MHYFDFDNFIKTSITEKRSLLTKDLSTFRIIGKEINGKKVLVIGGAGTIGSSYIRALIRYNPSKLVVVDINENGLTELVRTAEAGKSCVPDDFKPSYALAIRFLQDF
jgi:FlaA1/EpsC-like NDP-sugar epimerase